VTSKAFQSASKTFWATSKTFHVAPKRIEAGQTARRLKSVARPADPMTGSSSHGFDVPAAAQQRTVATDPAPPECVGRRGG